MSEEEAKVCVRGHVMIGRVWVVGGRRGRGVCFMSYLCIGVPEEGIIDSGTSPTMLIGGD